MTKFVYLFLIMAISGCVENQSKPAIEEKEPLQASLSEQTYKKAYFASGCFWCSESIYESVIGVTRVVSGYSGGTGKNPTYKNYISKGHAETIEVTYDPKLIDFESLLDVYFGSQDVTQQNGQGPDLGPGYRSIIFYQNEKEKLQIENKISEIQKFYARPIAAEIKAFQKFWEAEDYHQNFKQKNPNNPYIKNVSLPRLYDFQSKLPEFLKEK